MIAVFSVVIALWIYPVIGIVLVLISKKKPAVGKWALRVSVPLAGLAVLGLLLNISTTSYFIDYFLFSLIYFVISYWIWWTAFHRKTLVMILGVVQAIFVFGPGYLLGSIGILGLAFIVADFDVEREIKIDNELIYKESSLGNAISDYRGTRVEIFKTICWCPVIEWRICKKEYFEEVDINEKINFYFDSKQEKIIIYQSRFNKNPEIMEVWSDTLSLN